MRTEIRSRMGILLPAAVVALTLAVASWLRAGADGWVGGAERAPMPPGVTVSEATFDDRRTVTLRVGDSDGISGGKDETRADSRCWSVTETDQAGRRNSVSSCTAGDDAESASRALGVVVVVSRCTSARAAVWHTATSPATTVTEMERGIFMAALPYPVSADSVSVGCVGADGNTGPFSQLPIAGG